MREKVSHLHFSYQILALFCPLLTPPILLVSYCTHITTYTATSNQTPSKQCCPTTPTQCALPGATTVLAESTVPYGLSLRAHAKNGQSQHRSLLRSRAHTTQNMMKLSLTVRRSAHADNSFLDPLRAVGPLPRRSSRSPRNRLAHLSKGILKMVCCALKPCSCRLKLIEARSPAEPTRECARAVFRTMRDLSRAQRVILATRIVCRVSLDVQ